MRVRVRVTVGLLLVLGLELGLGLGFALRRACSLSSRASSLACGSVWRALL